MGDMRAMNHLRALLEIAGIPYEYKPLPVLGGGELKIPDAETWQAQRRGVSVICFKGSWGYEGGLLECWRRTETVQDNGPQGWLTAKEAMTRIREAMA